MSGLLVFGLVCGSYLLILKGADVLEKFVNLFFLGEMGKLAFYMSCLRSFFNIAAMYLCRVVSGQFPPRESLRLALPPLTPPSPFLPSSSSVLLISALHGPARRLTVL